MLVQNRGDSCSDLSYDCIADLFRQGEDGEVVQLKVYCDGLPPDSASEPEVLVHLRRLVFSRVNRRVFRIVRQSCAALCTETETRYVRKKGVPAKIFHRYCNVVEQSVVDRLLGTDGDARSLFRRLRVFMQELSESEYRKIHRSRVEYIGRLAYTKALRALRREH